VVRIDQENNQLTVLADDGRRAAYDPRRLSGVSVYREETRLFSTGDRIQFRAPLREQRVGTNELGTIEKIDGSQMTIKLDGEKQRQITIDLDKFKHLDHGYAVTSISSQGLGAYRGILNANAYESAQLLNERTAYVANSRAIYDMQIYTNSREDLPFALDRRNDKEIALDALRTMEERREALEQRRGREIEREQTYDRGFGLSR
jgi:hypothetical protein